MLESLIDSYTHTVRYMTVGNCIIVIAFTRSMSTEEKSLVVLEKTGVIKLSFDFLWRYGTIKSYVSNFYVGMVVEKNGRRYIAIQNVAKIISVVEALYAILTVCLG